MYVTSRFIPSDMEIRAWLKANPSILNPDSVDFIISKNLVENIYYLHDAEGHWIILPASFFVEVLE